MGRRKRTVPAKLGNKLLAIRNSLGLTGEQLIEKLNCPSIPLQKAHISRYENGLAEPPLIVVLQYAKLAKVHMEAIVDDSTDLTLK